LLTTVNCADTYDREAALKFVITAIAHDRASSGAASKRTTHAPSLLGIPFVERAVKKLDADMGGEKGRLSLRSRNEVEEHSNRR
jgi:hypothetical protein